MRKLLFATLLLAAISPAMAQQYKINAALTGFADHSKFYLKDLSLDVDIDSAEIIGGKFTMQGKITSVKNFWLYNRSNKNFNYMTLTIGADKITVQGDIKDFPHELSVTGSPSQDVANKLNDQTKSLWKSRDSVVAILMPLAMGELQNDSIKNIIKPLSRQLKQLDSLRESITTQFIAENINSYTGLEQLYYLRSKYKIDDFKKIFSAAQEPYKTGSFGSRISNYIKVGNQLVKGDDYFDFEATDLKGKRYRISDYKGKYILLDFTETYCGPCIMAAENLKKIATQYSDQLQIITFYAETNKKVMQEGIDRDKFKWPTVWDGKGVYSDITLKYGVEGYPTFVLINPAGKIVAIESGFGTDENGKGNIEKVVEKHLMKAK